MLKGISVVICCYNSVSRIGTTLSYLANQDFNKGTPWEIIIVDNNSSDNTAEIVKEAATKFCISNLLRVVEEPVSGLSNARRTGILSAKYEFSVFCDDDNWLDKDYLRNAYEIMESDPEIGALGGQSISEHDVVPPEWFSRLKHNYAVGQQQEKSGDISARGYLWGAGLVVRTSVLQTMYNNGMRSLLSDRKGNDLSSGGDSEICQWFIMAGYKLWYDESLRFHHFIPKERLSNEYNNRLSEALIQSDDILLRYKSIIPFYREIKKSGYYLLLFKTFARLFFSLILLPRFVKRRSRTKQDLQLLLYPLLKFDPVLFRVQKEFLVPFKKISWINDKNFNCYN